jgi:branched-chain amino acid aminotransferase
MNCAKLSENVLDMRSYICERAKPMHSFISINGQIIRKGDGSISSAVFFGKGIFTTIAIFDGKSFLWEKHWRRLAANADKIGLDISEYDGASVAALLAEAIEQDGVVNGRARITFFDESPSPIWSDETEKKTSLSIITGDLRPMPKEFGLTVSPYLINSTSPLAGVKSCNYLENILAIDEAKDRGFHEAIRLNERGEITSGCMSNVFWLNAGKLYTPSLATGCLAGTTREFLLENIECEEVKVGIEQLREAEQIFLISAGIGVVCAAEFENKKLSEQSHPILELLPPSI